MTNIEYYLFSQALISLLAPEWSVLLGETRMVWWIVSKEVNWADLHVVQEVEDHLQDRTHDDTNNPGHHEDDDSLVRIIFLWFCSNGPHQKVMSCDDLEAFNQKNIFSFIKIEIKFRPVKIKGVSISMLTVKLTIISQNISLLTFHLLAL